MIIAPDQLHPVFLDQARLATLNDRELVALLGRGILVATGQIGGNPPDSDPIERLLDSHCVQIHTQTDKPFLKNLAPIETLVEPVEDMFARLLKIQNVGKFSVQIHDLSSLPKSVLDGNADIPENCLFALFRPRTDD